MTVTPEIWVDVKSSESAWDLENLHSKKVLSQNHFKLNMLFAFCNISSSLPSSLEMTWLNVIYFIFICNCINVQWMLLFGVMVQDGDVKMLWPGPDTLILMARVMSHVSNIWRLWLWPALAREGRNDMSCTFSYLIHVSKVTPEIAVPNLLLYTLRSKLCTLYE